MNTVKLPELKGCPFCGCEMRVESNRDWHCLIGDHGPSCIFTDNEPATGSWPATDEALDEMAAFWNARAAVEASQPAASMIERAAKYGWRHSSWDWDSVRIGLEQFTPPAPKAEAEAVGRVAAGMGLLHGAIASGAVNKAEAVEGGDSMREWSVQMAAKEAGQTVTAGAHGIPDEPSPPESGGQGDYRREVNETLDGVLAWFAGEHVGDNYPRKLVESVKSLRAGFHPQPSAAVTGAMVNAGKLAMLENKDASASHQVAEVWRAMYAALAQGATPASEAVTEAGEKASVLAAIKFLRPEYEAWSDTRKVAFDRITTAALSQGVAHPSAAVTEATIEAAWRAATPIEGETGGAAFRRGIEAAIRHHALSQGGKP